MPRFGFPHACAPARSDCQLAAYCPAIQIAEIRHAAAQQKKSPATSAMSAEATGNFSRKTGILHRLTSVTFGIPLKNRGDFDLQDN
jgi:hypothetical protein